MVFYKFCYYFWGQIRWRTETNILSCVHGFCFFYKFPLPETLLMVPLSYLSLLRRPWLTVCMHNRRQRVSNRGALRFCGGGLTF